MKIFLTIILLIFASFLICFIGVILNFEGTNLRIFSWSFSFIAGALIAFFWHKMIIKAKIEDLKIGTKIIDKKDRVGVVIEDEGELFFDFIDSKLLVRATQQEIYGRQIKILKKIWHLTAGC